MSTRDKYVEKMKSELDDINAEIDKLAAKSESAKENIQCRYKQEMANLRAQSKQANAKLEELMAKTTGTAWSLRWIEWATPSSTLTTTSNRSCKEPSGLHAPRPDGLAPLCSWGSQPVCWQLFKRTCLRISCRPLTAVC
ncbi:MAG: hypothetical protein U5K56_00245 [Halioglobus sp.]|nr:hypothetical protein [Halioglobus sp.]